MDNIINTNSTNSSKKTEHVDKEIVIKCTIEKNTDSHTGRSTNLFCITIDF